MARNNWWYAAGATLLLLTVALVTELRQRQQPHEKAARALPGAPVPSGRAAAARMLPSDMTKAPSETGTYEVCGFGKAPAQIESDALNEYVFALTQKAGERWRAALLDSSDLRARAMGLLRRRAESLFHRSGQNDEALAKSEEDAREELVQLAAGSTDPVVYATATWICRSGTQDPVRSGACARISLRGLARIDPDNAMPRLAMAAEDRIRGDSRAEAADFAEAASSHKSDFYQDALLRAALAEVPSDATPVVRMALGTEAIGILVAQPLLELPEASRSCSTEKLQQPGRHESCEALGRLWVDHGRSLLEFGLGKAIGHRLGWTPGRLSQLDQDFNAMMDFVRDDPSDPWSCQSVTKDNGLLEGRAQQGEVDFLRGMLERSAP